MVLKTSNDRGSWASKDGWLIVGWTGLGSLRPYWVVLQTNLCKRHESHNTIIRVCVCVCVCVLYWLSEVKE